MGEEPTPSTQPQKGEGAGFFYRARRRRARRGLRSCERSTRRGLAAALVFSEALTR
jgi:hypothetical protein